VNLPTVTVEIVDLEDGEVKAFELRTAALTADPDKLSQMERAISLLYSYREVMKRLIEMAAPTTARGIQSGEFQNESP